MLTELKLWNKVGNSSQDGENTTRVLFGGDYKTVVNLLISIEFVKNKECTTEKMTWNGSYFNCKK